MSDLTIRPPFPHEEDELRELVIRSFEPITWFRRVDERFGAPGGVPWRERWQSRLDTVFAGQELLAGETGGRLVAFASAAADLPARLALIDLLAVAPGQQGKGYGRLMLRSMMRHLQQLGCEYVHLECLEDNEAGNRLYQAEGFSEVVRSIRWYKRIG